MVVAIDWDVKKLIKQTKTSFCSLTLDYIEGFSHLCDEALNATLTRRSGKAKHNVFALTATAISDRRHVNMRKQIKWRI